MTVEQLIEKLKQFPPHLTVWTRPKYDDAKWDDVGDPIILAGADGGKDVVAVVPIVN